MKIAVGSKNPVKIKAVEYTLQEARIQGSFMSIDAPSNVSEMPFSDEETMQGAINRAEYCLKHMEADVAIGLEGGVMETPFGLFLCNWGALAENGKTTLLAGGARIKLPDEIAVNLRAGEELGPLMDIYSRRENVRSKEGAIGIFTNGMVNRDELFIHIMKLLIGQKGDWFK
ncbi:DUF84 family protein [Lederbergia citrea]|uniref:inosine/xanthosine triphosphatase n=1 Tax=Lederbergia citrea TaxID=2833581 RepID=A0A942Z4V2_9BACI|nr:DUF84 family protein [Lederbergia citrea]MBS4175980.1 DUF84 family protein [Lederbergia citrea]MBS4222792.1 DUF84 family protein [Lederbergia citrea]